LDWLFLILDDLQIYKMMSKEFSKTDPPQIEEFPSLRITSLKFYLTMLATVLLLPGDQPTETT
jgi:hypothetical protein